MMVKAKICWLFSLRFPESLVWRRGGKGEIYWVPCGAGELSSTKGWEAKQSRKPNRLETDSEHTRGNPNCHIMGDKPQTQKAHLGFIMGKRRRIWWTPSFWHSCSRRYQRTENFKEKAGSGAFVRSLSSSLQAPSSQLFVRVNRTLMHSQGNESMNS